MPDATTESRHPIVRVELARAIEMFEQPTVELGSSIGGYSPGIERCITELTAHPDRGTPPRFEVALPAEEIADGLAERMTVTLRRVCEERIRHNDCTQVATVRAGFRSFAIGLPVTMLGLAITAGATKIGDIDDAVRAVVDILGWVLAWVGLWYPFDKILFYPLDAARENRVLAALRDAEVRIVPLE